MLPFATACLGLLLAPPLAPRRAGPIEMMGRAKVIGDRVTFIDGNNLMMQRKVTKGRELLAEKLAGVKGSKIVLVFDGKKGEEESSSGIDPEVVVTFGGNEHGDDRVSADEWIIAQLQETVATTGEVQVVTADKELRRVCQRTSAKTINPVKFWRRYLPRLKGLKSDYSNAPKENDEW